MKPRPGSGLICLFLAPLFYGAMSVSAKLAGSYLSIWQIGVGRFILGLVGIPLLVWFLGLSLWGRKRLLLTVRGVCGAMAFLFLVAAFQLIPLSLAMILFYLYPAFTALLSPWVAGEPTARAAWPFVCGSFAGIVVILWPGEASPAFNAGHVSAAAAAVLCALTLLLVRRLGRENNIYTLFFYLCLTGTLAGLGPLLLSDLPILPQAGPAWLAVMAVAVFSVGAQLSINQALASIPASRVSVMMTAEVPLVACFGVLFLGEPVTLQLVFGALLIFGCGCALNLLPLRPGG